MKCLNVKNVKRITKIILLNTLISVCFFASVNAYAAGKSGACGDNAKWMYDSDAKTLTISGTGAIKDYSTLVDIPWKEYCADIKTVTISEGITQIGKNSLTWFENADRIVLPSTLKVICEHGLAWNSSVTDISLPEGVEKIKTEAFAGCDALLHIEIPESVATIETPIFTQCISLKAIDVKKNNSVYYSDDGVLYSKNNELIAYPLGCTDNTFTIPENVKVIRDSAFREAMYLKNIDTGNVDTIEKRAFSGCENLTDVELKSVKKIEKIAFYGCKSLQKVVLPLCTEVIGEEAFRNCKNLQIAEIKNNNAKFGKDVFRGDTKIHIVADNGSSAKKCANDNNFVFCPLVSVLYNNTPVEFAPSAFIIDSSTMVPMRQVFEMLEATVDWNNATHTATATKDGITISITIGSHTLLRNGEPIALPQPGRLIAEKTYLPLRAVSEAFGNTVEWNSEPPTVSIY